MLPNFDYEKYNNRNKLRFRFILFIKFFIAAAVICIPVIYYIGVSHNPRIAAIAAERRLALENLISPQDYILYTDDIYEPKIVNDPLYEPSEPAILHGIKYAENGGIFELPVRGATGWAANNIHMWETPSPGAIRLTSLSPGQGFTILEESDSLWYIRLSDGTQGWIQHRGAFVNLPDILPSIIYRITNVSGAVFKSSGYDIPKVTNVSFYDGRAFNYRLNRYEYIVPLMYTAAIDLAAVQKAAMYDGFTIVVYEAFRPRFVQREIETGLRALMNTNADVQRAINTPPWHIGWFIATGTSNHQRGAALDVSLARVNETEVMLTGDYLFYRITDYQDMLMPTPMHELSPQAAVFNRAVVISTINLLPSLNFAENFGLHAERMQNYFIDAGFLPLASEWWHFDHPYSSRIGQAMRHTGDFTITEIFSTAPCD